MHICPSDHKTCDSCKRVSTAYKGECTHDMHRERWTGGAHEEGGGGEEGQGVSAMKTN